MFWASSYFIHLKNKITVQKRFMASFQMSFQVGRGPARPAMELLLLVLTVRVFIVTSV